MIRIAALAAGLAVIWIVVASPLAHLDHHLLTAHMVKHLLLMLVAAPLILFGARSLLLRDGVLRLHSAGWRAPLR